MLEAHATRPGPSLRTMDHLPDVLALQSGQPPRSFWVIGIGSVIATSRVHRLRGMPTKANVLSHFFSVMGTTKFGTSHPRTSMSMTTTHSPILTTGIDEAKVRAD